MVSMRLDYPESSQYFGWNTKQGCNSGPRGAAKLGIWSMPNPTPPWDFRHGKGVAQVEIGQPNTVVFLSRTGTKYHRGDCRFVSKSKLPTTLQRALGKYTACGVCGPPLLQAVAKPPAADMKRKVFVTRTGGTYHRDGCHWDDIRLAWFALHSN